MKNKGSKPEVLDVSCGTHDFNPKGEIQEVCSLIGGGGIRMYLEERAIKSIHWNVSVTEKISSRG